MVSLMLVERVEVTDVLLELNAQDSEKVLSRERQNKKNLIKFISLRLHKILIFHTYFIFAISASFCLLSISSCCSILLFMVVDVVKVLLIQMVRRKKVGEV